MQVVAVLEQVRETLHLCFESEDMLWGTSLIAHWKWRCKMLMLSSEVASRFISWQPTGRIIKNVVFLANIFWIIFNLNLSQLLNLHYATYTFSSEKAPNTLAASPPSSKSAFKQLGTYPRCHGSKLLALPLDKHSWVILYQLQQQGEPLDVHTVIKLFTFYKVWS